MNFSDVLKKKMDKLNKKRQKEQDAIREYNKKQSEIIAKKET